VRPVLLLPAPVQKMPGKMATQTQQLCRFADGGFGIQKLVPI
jgi:hypothetical protein